MQNMQKKNSIDLHGLTLKKCVMGYKTMEKMNMSQSQVHDYGLIHIVVLPEDFISMCSKTI